MSYHYNNNQFTEKLYFLNLPKVIQCYCASFCNISDLFQLSTSCTAMRLLISNEGIIWKYNVLHKPKIEWTQLFESKKLLNRGLIYIQSVRISDFELPIQIHYLTLFPNLTS